MPERKTINGVVCPLPVDNVTIENAQFMYKPNFEGREERFNEAGVRYFNVRIPDNIVDKMVEDGWNIKWTKPRNEEYQPEPYLEVAIGFKYRPPTIVVVQDGRETLLGEESAALIDSMEFQTFDVVIRGRNWENDMGCGIKAWLKTFYGVIEMDDIQRKYARLRNSED